MAVISTGNRPGDRKIADLRAFTMPFVLKKAVSSRIPVEKRLETFRNARDAGLSLGICVEPVGSEHAIGELVEKTIITCEAKPVYSGLARRIPISGTERPAVE